jgi:hypothetical protein
MACPATKERFSLAAFGWSTTMSSSTASMTRVRSSNACSHFATMLGSYPKSTIPKSAASLETFRKPFLISRSSTALTTLALASKPGPLTTDLAANCDNGASIPGCFAEFVVRKQPVGRRPSTVACHSKVTQKPIILPRFHSSLVLS